MNKKTIIKWVVGAVVLYVAIEFFFSGSDCEPCETVKMITDLPVFV